MAASTGSTRVEIGDSCRRSLRQHLVQAQKSLRTHLFAFIPVSARVDRASALHDRDGVIKFQHRRKISSILIRNTLVPLAIRTAPGSCLGIEGVKSPNTRSRYEYRPSGLAKKVRTAVGRQICAAGARTAVPKERA